MRGTLKTTQYLPCKRRQQSIGESTYGVGFVNNQWPTGQPGRNTTWTGSETAHAQYQIRYTPADHYQRLKQSSYEHPRHNQFATQ
jgi:hypothetical protein